jgi:hypothetical protein
VELGWSVSALVGALFAAGSAAMAQPAEPRPDSLAVDAGGYWSWTPAPVPPPDYVPRWMYADTNLVRRTVKNVAVVLFRERASAAERQAAVDAVGGLVVGGARWFGDDGAYLVRVPLGPGRPTLAEAVDRLNALPQVQSASTERCCLSENRPPDR